MATQLFAQEPLFYGKGAKEGLTPEDFIRRVDTMKASTPWNDQVAVAKAVSYLREAGNKWLEGMLLWQPDVHAEAIRDYRVFRREFVRDFFAFADKEDLHCAWGDLKQAEKEDVVTFSTRVMSTVNEYAQLIPLVDPSQAAQDAVRLAVDNFEAAQNANTRRALEDAIIALSTDATAAQKTAVCADIAMKFLCEGLRGSRMKEKARAEVRKRQPVRDTLRSLVAAEKVLGGPQAQEQNRNNNARRTGNVANGP